MVQAQDNGVLLMASMVGALTGLLLSGLLTSCFPGRFILSAFILILAISMLLLLGLGREEVFDNIYIFTR